MDDLEVATDLKQAAKRLILGSLDFQVPLSTDRNWM